MWITILFNSLWAHWWPTLHEPLIFSGIKGFMSGFPSCAECFYRSWSPLVGRYIYWLVLIVCHGTDNLECSDWSLLKLQYLMWHTQVFQHCGNDSRKTLRMTNLDAKINIELNECLKPSQGAVVSPFPIVLWNSEIKSSVVCQLSSLG